MPPLLEARRLRRVYPGRGGSASAATVTAVDEVSLRVGRGECLAVVGASGSGKSTLARLLVALERPDAGWVVFDGQRISHLNEARVRPMRRRFQPVFQDPRGALDPRLPAGTSIAEALVSHGPGDRRERREQVEELLAEVGLPADVALRRPAALSGGERQRVTLARALASRPELLVLDEPVSSVDLVTRRRLLHLLSRLRRARRLTMVLVSHDLDTVKALADRAVVMYRGRLVEEGQPEELLRRPQHPHTRELVAARLVLPGSPS